MNHGTVIAEIAEYTDKYLGRAVVCELKDGWHVVECYVPGKITTRHVCESLSDARAYALAWIETAPSPQGRTA